MTNNRKYGSIRECGRNARSCVRQRMCGRVNVPEMKYHDILQVYPSIQAYRKHLKAYVKIGVPERGNIRTCDNPLQGHGIRETGQIA